MTRGGSKRQVPEPFPYGAAGMPAVFSSIVFPAFSSLGGGAEGVLKSFHALFQYPE
jgi:hypothetical protein